MVTCLETPSRRFRTPNGQQTLVGTAVEAFVVLPTAPTGGGGRLLGVGTGTLGSHGAMRGHLVPDVTRGHVIDSR